MNIDSLPTPDRIAIRKHIAYLQAEPCAVSLNATLPSGLAVTIYRDGTVSAQ